MAGDRGNLRALRRRPSSPPALRGARRPGWRRRFAVLAAVLVAVPVVLLATAGPASAHARLVRSDPPAGASLARPPSQVVLSFSEPVREPLTVLVTDAAGESAAAGAPRIDGLTIVQPLRADAEDGRWTVAFRVIGTDAHPVAGISAFSVGTATGAAGDDGSGPARSPVAGALAALALLAGAWTVRTRRRTAWGLVAVAAAALVGGLVLGGGAPQPVPAGLPDAGSVVGWGRPLLRRSAEAGLVVAFGLRLGAAALVRPARRPGEAATARVPATDVALAGATAGAAALAVLAQLQVTSSDIRGVGLVDGIVGADPVAFMTQDAQGRALAVQLLLAGSVAVLGLGVAVGRAGVPRRTAGGLAALAAAALLPPLTVGHVAVAGGPGLSQTVLVVHVLAAAGWVGGLVAIARSAAVVGTSGLRVALPSFSRLALGCAAAVGLTGVANAALRMGGVGQLLDTGYGVLVVGKVVAFGALVGFGVVQRRRLAALLAGSSSSAGSAFVRLALAEIAVMAGTFGLAAALTRTPSPARTPVPVVDGADVLGYPPPPEASPLRLLTGHLWDGPGLLLVALVTAALVVLVRRTRPGRRATGWALAAVVVLAWAVVGGLAVYARVALPAHVAAHLLVAVVVPILLLRAGFAALAPRLRAVPAVLAASLVVVGTVAVYLPSAFTPTMAAPGGYWLATALGLVCGVVGLARAVPVAGSTGGSTDGSTDGSTGGSTDGSTGGEAVPLLAVPERLLVLGAGVVACAGLTWWLVGTRTLLGEDWFTSFSVPYLRSFGDDQRRAGFVAWFAGGLPLLAVLAALVVRGGGSSDAAVADTALPADGAEQLDSTV
ncbi:MAG: copper resistance protein CopC [Kineosporiaceae bacterium]